MVEGPLLKPSGCLGLFRLKSHRSVLPPIVGETAAVRAYDFEPTAYDLSSDLLVCAEGAARVDWISCARSRSTLVFNTVPPRPRILCNITSISPSSSRTK